MEVTFLKWKCNVILGKYANSSNAIVLHSVKDGSPVATASINLVYGGLRNNEIAIKNYSENEGMLDCLVQANIISKPLRYAHAGFVTIPICKLLIENDKKI